LVKTIRDHSLKDDSLFKKILNIKVPLLIIINKIDLIDQEKLYFELDFWKNKVPNA
jgi:GTP-binding protein Era